MRAAAGAIAARTSATSDLGDAEPERPLDDERGGTALDRRRREVMAVAREAADAEEDAPGPHLAVVVGERADLQAGVLAGRCAE